MSKPKMAILADIASCKISCEGFKMLLEKIETRFEVVYCKFYSYVAKRNRDFNEFIAAKGYDAVTNIASRRRNKLDSRQIIDGTEIGMSSTVDAVAFMVGEGDILPILTYLKAKGKDVYEIAVEKTKFSGAYTGFIQVPVSALKTTYAAPATKPAAVKKPKPVAPKKPAVENPYLAQAKSVLEGKSILNQYRR